MCRRYGLAIVAILFTALLLPKGSTAQPVSPSSELLANTRKAGELLDRYYGDPKILSEAQAILIDVLNQNPEFVPAYLEAARLMVMGGHIVSKQFRGGSLEGAESILVQASELEPSNADAHLLLGHIYFLAGDDDGSLRELQVAAALKSSSPWLNNNFGDVYFGRREWDVADARYKLVERLGKGNTPQQRRAYVHALTKRQQIAAFRDDNEEVLRLGKLATGAAAAEDAWTWGEVANVLFVQGYFDESIANSRKALSIMSYGVGRNNLALALYGKWATLTENGQDGEAYFEEAYSIQPDLNEIMIRFQQSASSVVRLTGLLRTRQRDILNSSPPGR